MLNSENRSRPSLETWRHLGMGVVYLLFAALVINAKTFGTIGLSETVSYALGVLMVVYGVFRLYRGISGIRQARRGE